MKDLIQDRINQKTFFVYPCGYINIEDSINSKDAVGIVDNFEIKDGQGYLDIQFIRDTAVINLLGQDNLLIDFLLVAKTDENNIVDLTNMQIHGVKLTVHNKLIGE